MTGYWLFVGLILAEFIHLHTTFPPSISQETGCFIAGYFLFYQNVSYYCIANVAAFSGSSGFPAPLWPYPTSYANSTGCVAPSMHVHVEKYLASPVINQLNQAFATPGMPNFDFKDIAVGQSQMDIIEAIWGAPRASIRKL